MKTFKDWIVEYADTNYLVGDLAEDIKGDKHFPESNDHDTLRNYLEFQNNDVAVEIFDVCWAFYKMLFIEED